MFGTAYTLGYLILNFVVLIFGIIAHFFKKKIKGETVSDIINYFKSNFKNTVATILAALVAFVSLVATGALGIVVSFTTGYAADSLFNKSEGDVRETPKDDGQNG